MIRAVGNTSDPKLIIVLPYPDKQEWENQELLSSYRNLIRNALGSRINEAYITCYVKTSKYQDPITQQGNLRKPIKEEIEYFKSIFEQEISKFNNYVLMPLGKSTLEYLGFPGKITQLAGAELSWNGKRVIPNHDPNSFIQSSRMIPEFKRILDKAFQPVNMESTPILNSDGSVSYQEPEHKTLNFEQAVTELKRTYQLYMEGEIDYWIFDIECTSFNPWSGEMIMYSFYHNKTPCGYSVPLKIQNEITIPKPAFANAILGDDFKKQVNLECSKQGLPERIKEKEDKKKYKKIEMDIAEDIYKKEHHKYLTDIEITPFQVEKLNKVLSQVLKTVPTVGHNFKFDAKWIHWHGVCSLEEINIKDDTWIMAFQLYNKQKGSSLSLGALCNKLFNISWKNLAHDYLNGYRLTKDRHYGNIPTKILGEYAAKDAYWNGKLYNLLKLELPPSMDYITDIVTQCTKVFAEVELKGIAIDWKVFEFIKKNYETRKEQIEKEVNELPIIQSFIADLKDKKFTMNSPEQMSKLWFNSKYYNLPKKNGKKFKSKIGQKTDKDVVEYFLKNKEEKNILPTEEEYDVLIKKFNEDTSRANNENFYNFLKKGECRKFLNLYKDWKRIGGKLLPTYIYPVPEKSPENLYRPEYFLTGTVTGRLSSGFHTVDTDSDITRIFTSRWKSIGGLILAPDFSQLEVRVVACLSGEKNLLEAYQKGFDIHATTASKVYGIPIDRVTHKQRQVGKQLNFFTIYGGGSDSLGEELGITKEEAQTMLDKFFAGYPTLTSWRQKQIEFTKETGFVETIWGRRIPIPSIHAKEKWLVEKGEREATNYPVQSSASDIVLWCLLNLYKNIKRKGLKSLIIGSIHDSVELDNYPGEMFKILQLFKRICEKEVIEKHSWIKCPLKVSTSLGSSWGGAIEFDIEEITDSKLVLVGEGLRKDFLSIKNKISCSYKVNLSVIDTRELNYTDFGSEIFFRDSEMWKVKLTLELV